MTTRVNSTLVLSVLISIVVILAISSVTFGQASVNVFGELRRLLGAAVEIPAHEHLILYEIRLPRTLLCLSIGAILATCGTVTQGLFRNPLADPGIIGVSSGAALGAGLAIVVFEGLVSSYPILMKLTALPVFAFVGGALTTILVYRLGTSRHGTSVMVMLLAGVAVGALTGAAMGYLNYLANDEMLRRLSLWTMGSVGGATWDSIALSYLFLVILVVFFYRQADALNALLLGEPEARHLGVNVQKLKRHLIIAVAIGVGVTVSIAGMIGFIGLVVPHLVRLMCGPDHRIVIPFSAILGAALLTFADILARVVVAPAELPVGILTALIGAPFFLYLLAQQRGKLI